MVYISIILTGICLIQFFYIKNLHKQLKEWLDDLKEIRQNPRQKLFVQKKGLLSGIIFILNDILAENQKQITNLKKSELANKQMLTNLSHDVRTPLASLLGYLEALNNNLTNTPKEYIETSYQKAFVLKSFIDMLFEWCKVSSHEQQYELLSKDINELTREIIIDWLPLLEKNKIELKVNIPEDELLINIDPIAYKRIINNLLQNAIYHGHCSIIAIYIKSNGKKVNIHISNNGMAIPKDKLPFIFERLYKCDDARSDTGSGLGLTIAKELVLAMDGNIYVDSSNTKGTTFTLLFSAM